MSERDSVVLVVNVQLARMAGEKVAGEIWKRWYAVSVSFLNLDILELTLFPRSRIRSGK